MRPFPAVNRPMTPLLVGPRLDDLWDAWSFAATDATLALTHWQRVLPSERPRAYAAYEAALDREAQAAQVLAQRLGRRRAAA
jgi:hypothetical protein